MEFIAFIFDFIIHVDRYLADFVATQGIWVYGLLFLIIFVETGLVVMPFLPGDSLLFIVGAMGGSGLLDATLAAAIMWAAAVAGNQSNYSIGRAIGPRVFQWENSRLFNRNAFLRAHAFYERYGGITIVLARFMPFVRTFAPFVAGVAQMNRRTFSIYDVSGGGLWVVGLVTVGYQFGNIPWIQHNLEKIIWGLILLPGLLTIGGGIRSHFRGDAPKADTPQP